MTRSEPGDGDDREEWLERDAALETSLVASEPGGLDGSRSDRRSRGLIGPFTARHVWAFIGAVAVVAVLLIAATSPFSSPAQDGPVPEPGASFYPIGAQGAGLAVGQRPPPFASADDEPVRDLDGDVVELAALEGRPVWVLFWATWCPPCQQETPDIQRAWEANADRGLEILAVNVQEGADIVADYAASYGLTYGMAVDRAGSAFRNWTVFGLPTHYFIDREGIIRDRFFGPLRLEQMQSIIDRIVGS